MTGIEELAEKMDALGHPLRLRLIAILYRNGPTYLSELAKMAKVSRALAKVHLIKLQRAGLVKTSVRLLPGEAKALRYYELVQFSVSVSPSEIAFTLGQGGTDE